MRYKCPKCGATGAGSEDYLPKCHVCNYEIFMMPESLFDKQLQQARREGKAEGIRLGWEQAKREAQIVAEQRGCHYYDCAGEISEAISAMTYKER